ELVDELFPEQRDAVWRLCAELINHERLHFMDPVAEVENVGAGQGELEAGASARTLVASEALDSQDEEACSATPLRAHPVEANLNPDTSSQQARPLFDDLTRRITTWSSTFAAPQIGAGVHDLIR